MQMLRRGTCQPYCRSLPDDPLLECLEIGDESNVKGLNLVCCDSYICSLLMLGVKILIISQMLVVFQTLKIGYDK